MRKFKIAGLIASQIVLTYLVFIICIQQPRSKQQQIEDALGSQRSHLRDEEARLNSIIFKNARHPTTVTIVETRKMSKPDTNQNALSLLRYEDQEFLISVSEGK